MTTERNATMRGGNRFKLAVFGSNCSSGRAATKVPERWENTFEDNVRLARMSDEIGMFGLEQDPHDDRYARGREWLEILTRMWSEEEPFDYAGHYYQLKGVTGRPLPWGGRRPILMNAGNSVTGRTFGARHCDMVFDQPHYLDAARDRIVETRSVARELGREIQVFTSGAVVCRPTQNEADEYFRYFAVEHRDDEAIDTMFKLYLNPANQRSMTR